MIPPEPEPEPDGLSYATATEFLIADRFSATFYTDIHLDGVPCQVTVGGTRAFNNLVIYTDVQDNTRYYFAEGTLSDWYGLLDGNFTVGSTNPVYHYNNGTSAGQSNQYVDASVPTGYVDLVESGDFTLTQR